MCSAQRFEIGSRLEADGQIPQIDVIGEGGLHSALAALAENAHHPRVGLLQPVPCGTEFLTLLRDYHTMIVSTTGDEQSRVIYDANSRAVPVIATDTPGNRDVIFGGQTGCLPKWATAQILAEILVGWFCEPAQGVGLHGIGPCARLYA